MGLGQAVGMQGDRPGLEAERDRPLNLKVLWRIYRYMAPYAAMRNWVFVLSAARAVQRPAHGLVIAAIINGPIRSGNASGAVWGALGFLLLALVTEITFHFRMKLALQLGERVTQSMRQGLFEKMQALTMSFYNQTKLGSMLSRFISDIENVRRGVQTVFFFALMMLGQMVIAAGLMLFYNPVLFALLAVVAPGVYWINTHFRFRLSHWSRAAQVSQSRLTSKIAEAVNGMKLIQTFAREEQTAREFQGLIATHSDNNQNLARDTAIYLPLLELNSQFFLSLLLVFGGYGALSGGFESNIDDFVAFFFLANYFFTPIQNIGRVYTQALASMAGAERVFELLDREPDWREGPPLSAPQSVEGGIEAEDVAFSYSKYGPRVLQDIDFRIDPGQSVALVGHTGSGKSTLAGLICKFYQPSEGEIRLDGVSLSDLDGYATRDHFGIVTQSPFLFEGTVLDNILLGRPDAGAEAARAAVESLGCLDLLEALPRGLDSEVGENGKNLSLGQRQLVCFARAALRDPAVLVLDEATSSVDAVTEVRLQSALKKLMRRRTCIIIAHRLGAIVGVDQILVLRSGRIVERGTHSELLGRNSYYADMYREYAGAGV